MEDELTSHEKREQEKRVQEEERLKKAAELELKQTRKNYLWMALTLLILIAFAVLIGYFMKHRPQTYSNGEVHWHALIDITICGEHKDLPRGIPQANGEVMLGNELLHTHDDNVLHIEGQIRKKEDIALGKFFDIIKVPFDKDKIMDKKNGDLCDGKPGTLKMYVNDLPRTDFRDYIPFATARPEKQVIKLVFEPEGVIAKNISSS